MHTWYSFREHTICHVISHIITKNTVKINYFVIEIKGLLIINYNNIIIHSELLF